MLRPAFAPLVLWTHRRDKVVAASRFGRIEEENDYILSRYTLTYNSVA